MRKEIAVLSDEELELIQMGRENADIVTDYWFRPAGTKKGWIFDDNFAPEGAWQRMLHHASQRRIMVVGGFGSGKTRGVAVSACVWCMSVPDFAFLNAAPKAWQSELMYNFILQISRGTPFERLIFASPKRPYPRIELRFIVKGKLFVSTMEFMSVEKNANTILGWEGDWANIDEAGQLDELGDIITNLGSRLRGAINGRSRLGRLSMITNSWENPEMWYRYDLAADLPEDYLSITVSSRHNHNITPEQLKMMLKDIPEDEHERFIDGARPEGKGNYFSRHKVYVAEDANYGAFIRDQKERGLPGFDLQSVYGAGVVYFTTPAFAHRSYMLLGDPGTGEAPNRNAPVLMVWDVTEFPRNKAGLVAAWWGAGRGQITPFINRLLTFMQTYNPILTAVDSTGTQKNTNQLLNLFLSGQRADPTQTQTWTNVDVSKILNPTVGGMDFSGSRKPAYLIAGRLLLEAELVYWPKFFSGLRSQLTNYDPDKDRSDVTSKIAQDLVATFCMSAFAIRAFFAYDPNLLVEKAEADYTEVFGDVGSREVRLGGDARNLRSPRS